MDSITEHFFLDELLSLCNMAGVHASAIGQAMSDWMASDLARARALELRPLVHELDLIAADARYDSAMQARIAAQSEIFLRLEAYFAVHGRIAEILRPKLSHVHGKRAAELRSLLEQGDVAWEADYQARNKWIHFDEYLDNRAMAGPDHVQPQRTCLSSDLRAGQDHATLRLITVDDCCVRLPTVGRVDLRAMFGRVRELESHVRARLHDWGARARPT